MAVRFIIGRAGTGKTAHCFDAIVERCATDALGPAVFWILPKQATFTAERELTCSGALPGGYARARLVSFEQMGSEILAECGGVAIPEVTAVGRQMVLGHLLRKHHADLKFFRSVAHQTGLAAELDRAFAELERNGNTSDSLGAIVREFDESGNDESATALAAKLHDLHLLYRAYSAYLGQERLDPHLRLQHVLSCVADAPSLRGAAVFVDGFYDFTDYQRRFLAVVARVCERVEIALTMVPNSALLAGTPPAASDALGTFHPIDQTYRRLHAALDEARVEVSAPLILRKPTRFATSAGLAHLEACLFTRHPKPHPDGDSIRFIEAPDRRSEVDAVARHIQLLVERGLRMREIAVLMRSLEPYHDVIQASFAEHGLPYFADRRRTAAHHPLIQFVRALAAVATHAWEHDAAIILIKSGLVPLVDTATLAPDRIDAETLAAADRLENYVLEHRIRNQAWTDERPWTYRRELLHRESEDPRAQSQHDEAAQMNDLRRKLLDPVLPFAQLLARADATHPLRHYVVAMLRVFHDIDIPATLARWIARDEAAEQFESRAEHVQVWNALTELLDQLVDLLGDEAIKPADFVEVLESGLESFDLALTPPTIDQILVGSIDRTRTGRDTRATIVLGLNEGEFPRCAAEGSIFRDTERRALAARKLELDPDTHRRLFDERFFGYIAFTRASEHLCLTRPTSDDAGRALAPSSFWNELRRIFVSIEPARIPRDANRRPDCIGTPRQLITSLLRWAQADTDHASKPAWPALYQKLAHHPPSVSEDDAIDRMRYRAWKALHYDNRAALSPDLTRQLFKSPLTASVSRIETFATCPFQHFARYGLRLDAREDQDVTALDLGNVYHGILEHVVRSIVSRREDFVSVPREFTDEQIRSCTKLIGQSLREELMISSARNKYLLKYAEQTVGRVVDAQREAARRGKFKPWKTELCFGLPGDLAGEQEQLPPFELRTPFGKVVRLYGKIDRVDRLDEEAAFAVIDYKLSGNHLSLDRVYHGLSLQLLTYLLVFEASGETLAGKKLTPAAAFYVQLLRKLEKVDHPGDATPIDDPRFQLKIKPRGLFDKRFLSALDSNLTRGSSDVVKAFVKADESISDCSDCTDGATFAALLRFVAHRIGELADMILAGDVSVSPYRIRTTTPCPTCPYRSVCRFDPARQDYRFLPEVTRQDVISKAKSLPIAGAKRRG